MKKDLVELMDENRRSLGKTSRSRLMDLATDKFNGEGMAGCEDDENPPIPEELMEEDE